MSKIILEGGLFDGEVLEVDSPHSHIWMMQEKEIEHPAFEHPLKRESKIQYIHDRTENGVLFYRYSDPAIYAR